MLTIHGVYLMQDDEKFVWKDSTTTHTNKKHTQLLAERLHHCNVYEECFWLHINSNLFDNINTVHLFTWLKIIFIDLHSDGQLFRVSKLAWTFHISLCWSIFVSLFFTIYSLYAMLENCTEFYHFCGNFSFTSFIFSSFFFVVCVWACVTEKKNENKWQKTETLGIQCTTFRSKSDSFRMASVICANYNMVVIRFWFSVQLFFSVVHVRPHYFRSNRIHTVSVCFFFSLVKRHHFHVI